jgi:Trypsin-like peptidase domain
MSRGDFEKAIKKAIASSDWVSALQLADQCIAAYPTGSKKCVEMKRSANQILVADWRQHLSKQPADNLPEIERALAQIARGGDDTVGPQLANVRAKLQDLKDNGAALVKQLHDNQGAVPLSMPADLATYRPYVPELAEVERELALHRELIAAKQLQAEGKTAEAIKSLNALKPNPEVSAVRSEIETAAATEISQVIESGLAADSWDGVVKAAEQVGRPELLLLPEADRNRLQEKIAESLKRRIQPLIPSGADRSATMAVTRVIAAKLPSNAQPSLDWSALGLNPPGILFSAEASAIHESCLDLNQAGVVAKLRESLPPFLQEGAGGTIKVAIENVRCASETTAAGEEPINSTYVASQQQITNPEYVRVQALLQQAQQQLANLRTQNALNPAQGAWAAAAQSLSESLAQTRVNSLAQQLNATPPFQSQPVVLSYTPYRYYVQRIVAMKAVLSVSDQLTGYADAVTLTADTTAKADGLRGVLPADRSNFSNRTPNLPSDSALIGQASAELFKDAAARLSQYAGELASNRAQHAARAKQPVVAAGYALLATDFGVTPEPQGPLASLLQQTQTVPIEKLSELKLPTVPARNAPVTKPVVRSAPPVTSRAGMLEQALSSVVTVSTEQGSGSGFFVGTKGLVVTNAHVVEGATRIIVRTRSKDSVLAKIVKLSLADDLALLTTVGLDAPGLPLGQGETAAIGQDVIAIGSPMGLEGTVTRGIISGIRQIGGIPYLQTDAPINPGNSGGPLLSERGEVLGVNTWKLAKQAEALGFAISVDRMKSVFAGFLEAK